MDEEIERVLAFWVDEIGPAGWYAQDTAVDARIASEFGALHEQAAARRLGDWMISPRGSLALIILLDQFSRNLFRRSGQAFASDRYCLSLAKGAVRRNHDLEIAEPQRRFFYMPLMHSEMLADQEQCLRMFLLRCPETGPATIIHAVNHREVIRRFGRFPSRNAALGRTDSDAELAYRAEGGYMSGA